MTMLKSLFAASAGLVGCAHAFWRMECPGRIGAARIDPIVNVGALSPHLHSIHGSSAFDSVIDTAGLLAGDCTSCRVTEDMSSYWAPAMYFKDANTGKFEMVEEVGGMLAYYLLNGENIKTFPKDFRMIAGDNTRRKFTAGDPGLSDPAKSNWAAMGETTQNHLEQRAVGFNCLNYEKDPEGTLYRHFMPDKDFLDANCKNGLRLELMFPSCWDGKNAQSDDHKSHVAYPDLVMSGQCPDSHPVSVPGLLFETIWDTSAFAGRDGMFVMSNGDVSGFGYHGDFIMGWESDFLQKAIKTCTSETGKIEDCPLFTIITEEKAKECEMGKKPLEALGLLGENIMEGLSILPGDVKVTYEGDVVSDDENDSKKPDLGDKIGDAIGDIGDKIGDAFGGGESSDGGEPKPKPKPQPSDEGDVPGQVFKESSAQEPPAAPSDQAGVQNAEKPDTTSSSSSSAPPPPPPTTTSKPTVTVDPDVSYARTEFVTNGNVVSKILWEEETVTVTEMVDSETTVVVDGGMAPSGAAEPEAKLRRRVAHLHHHGHRHF